MATVQTDGSSAVTSTSTVNNGGTFTSAGSSASAILASQQSSSRDLGVFGSVVVSGINTDAAVADTEFAHFHDGPIAMKVTTEIAGLSNNTLSSAANAPGLTQSIHQSQAIRTQRITTAIRSNKFNRYTGAWDGGYPVDAVDYFYSISAANTGVSLSDNAANPTSSVPGELTYMNGSRQPVTDEYAEKTMW